MATTQFNHQHKKFIQRKRSRDDDGEGINNNNTLSTDTDSSSDQETSNLPKQRKISKLTPKQKFKTEKAINELRLRIQKIDLNASEPSEAINIPTTPYNKTMYGRMNNSYPSATIDLNRTQREISSSIPLTFGSIMNHSKTIDLTKYEQATSSSSSCRRPISSTDTNGNIIKQLFAKRGRTEAAVAPETNKKAKEESLSDDEVNQKLLDIPLPSGPPPAIRRVTFGGFSQSSPPKEKRPMTFGGFAKEPENKKMNLPSQEPQPIAFGGFPQLVNTRTSTPAKPEPEKKIKFSSKKMGRNKTIKEVTIEDEWKNYKSANLSLSDLARRTSFGK